MNFGEDLMTTATGACAPRLSSWATLSCVAILSLFLATPRASADTMEIFFSGIHIEYDGTNIFDADPDGGSSDPVSASISVNGTPVLPLITGAQADLFIDNIALLANTTSAPLGLNSYFELSFPDGADGDSDRDFLRLDLENITVTYIDGAPKDFVFTASVSNAFSVSDSLPLDAIALLEAPLTLSFSAQTSSVTLGPGNAIAAFLASGTGEIRAEFDPDTGNVIPEPGTIGLAALAGLMGGAFVMRKRLG